MTYPPGNPGYPPAQPSGSYGPSTPSFAKPADVESKLPLYLQVAVVVLGLGVYLANFGPLLSVTDSEYPVILGGNAGYSVPLAVLAAVLAAVSLLPKAKSYTPVVAALAVLGALLAIGTVIGSGENFEIGWGLWLVLTFSILQAVAAVAAMLLEAGVITAPAPRPKYDPYAQYGLPPGGGYYGQPSGPQSFGPQGHQGLQGQSQAGYPSYGGYPSGPPSGGFSAPGAPSAPQSERFGTGPQSAPQSAPQSTPPSAPQGPPTPPTGFPTFSPPPGAGSSGSSPAQQPPGGPQPPTGSGPSGPAQP